LNTWVGFVRVRCKAKGRISPSAVSRMGHPFTSYRQGANRFRVGACCCLSSMRSHGGSHHHDDIWEKSCELWTEPAGQGVNQVSRTVLVVAPRGQISGTYATPSTRSTPLSSESQQRLTMNRSESWTSPHRHSAGKRRRAGTGANTNGANQSRAACSRSATAR
jgi:hypothetical protein